MHGVHPPILLGQREGLKVQPKFQKGGLTGPQLLEGGYSERGE